MVFLFGASAAAAESNLDLTLYRDNSDALFQGGNSPVAQGYAVIHERREINLDGSRQSVVIDGLPSTLDAEAVDIEFGTDAKILARRVLGSGEGWLAAQRGEPLTVFADDGKPIVGGTLLGLDGSSLIVRSAVGGTSYVRDYGRVEISDGVGRPGSTLQVLVDGGNGATHADLTYPTSGLGWRGAYMATLEPGDTCRIVLQALASIANRSGRDFSAAQLKLIAGAPNFAKPISPQPMQKARAFAANAPESLPQESQFGDYRSYVIDGSFDLPDSSISQVPLYAPQALPCVRTWLIESGGDWTPQRPRTADDGFVPTSSHATSKLAFAAHTALPQGYLRVLTRGTEGNAEFLGEDQIDDTPKGQSVGVTLGTAFNLTAERERTVFSVDQAAHEMKEGFRITLGNTGDATRTITLREHPNRWRNWTLTSSSAKPSKQTPDLLEFRIQVPANGKKTLAYTVLYQWTAAEQ